MPAFPDQDGGRAPTSCSWRFPWGIALPQLSAATSLCVRGVTVPDLATGGKKTGPPKLRPYNTRAKTLLHPLAGICWVLPSSSSKHGYSLLRGEGGAAFWHSSLRRKAWASPGEPARLSHRCPPRVLRSSVHAGLLPFTHPETVGAGCKTQLTCGAGNCCNTLAGASHSHLVQLVLPAAARQAGRGAAGVGIALPAARGCGMQRSGRRSTLRPGCRDAALGWHSPGFH